MFNAIALASSSIYFILLAALILTNVREINIGLIITIILPLIYFAKKFFEFRSNKELIHKYQIIVLLLYFMLVLVDSVLTMSYVDSGEIISYLRLFVLPILVIFSFYSIYQNLMSDKQPPRMVIALTVCLAFFYYLSLFSMSMDLAYKDTTIINYIIVFFSICLSVIFAYNSFKSRV